MSYDSKYVLKRVLIGVLIFLSIFLLKKYILLEVKASTLYPSSSCVILDVGDNQCSSPPIYASRPMTSSDTGLGFNVWFENSPLLESNSSYYITFSAVIQGRGVDNIMSDFSLFTGNNGSASSRAYPDRNEQFVIYAITSNTYQIQWSFELDSYSIFNTLRFSWFSGMNSFNGMIGGLQSAQLSITSNAPSGSDNSDIINNNNSSTQDIINNQNSNTQNIIDNQNSNAQSIIDNQDKNTKDQIDSQKVCKFIDNNTIVLTNSFLDSDGSIGSNNTYGVSDYIPIQSAEIIPTSVVASTVRYFCFYNINKALISCSALSTMVVDTPLTIPVNSAYFRTSIQKNNNRPTFKICQNGNQALNDSFNSEDTSQSKSDADSFFGSFGQYDDSRISSVLTAPLRFLNRLTDTCQPVSITYRGESISIPCGNTIFWDKPYVQNFRTWWNLFFGGMILYYLATYFARVYHDVFNPENDSMEVF